MSKLPSGTSGQQPPKTKLCRYCGSAMSAPATLCPTCRSYQGRYRNIIPYLASATGLFALVASAVTFVVSQIAEAAKNHNWKDNAEIVFFSSGSYPAFSIVAANVGDGPIFVTELLVRYGGGGDNAVYRVNAKIDKNDFFSNKVKLAHPAEYGEYISNFTGTLAGDVALNSDISTEQKPCFFAAFYSANSSDIARMNETYGRGGRKLVSRPVDLRLFFYGLHFGERKEVSVPAIQTFQRRLEKRCQDISVD